VPTSRHEDQHYLGIIYLYMTLKHHILTMKSIMYVGIIAVGITMATIGFSISVAIAQMADNATMGNMTGGNMTMGAGNITGDGNMTQETGKVSGVGGSI
jgi:hypothetical protein